MLFKWKIHTNTNSKFFAFFKCRSWRIEVMNISQKTKVINT
jgi:hypothetical protein